jgi:hypothetical protein
VKYREIIADNLSKAGWQRRLLPAALARLRFSAAR